MRIGVFDSGVGGVTVLNELTRALPSHEFLYFGDTANVPYGSKSAHHIQELVKSAAERIKTHRLDTLVVACNTASSLALPEFQSVLKIPILSVVDAGIHAIEEQIAQQNKPVLIFGTNATIRSKIYSRLLQQSHPRITVLEQACPLLVPMIEEGWTNHSILELTLAEYVKPHLPSAPGIALLACTHYPWIQTSFQKLLPKWEVINSATSVVKQVYDQFKLQSPMLTTADPKVQWHFSDPESVPLQLLRIQFEDLSKF